MDMEMDMEMGDELTLNSRILNIIKEIQNLQDGPGANLTSIYNGLNSINEGEESIEGVTVTITTDLIQEELNQLVLNDLLLRFISYNSGQQSFAIPQSSTRILDLSQCGGDYEHYILVMSKCIEQVKKELSKQVVNESSPSPIDTDKNTPDYHEMTEYIRHSFYIKFDEVDKKVEGLDKWSFLENLVRDTVQRQRLYDSQKEEKLEKLVTKSNELKEIEEYEGIEETEEGGQQVDRINKWVENTIAVNIGIRSKSKRLSEIAMKDPPVVQPPPKDCQMIAIKNFKELMSPKKKKAKRALYKIKNNMITYKGFKFQNPTVSLTRLPLNVIGGHDHNHDVNLNDNSSFASTPTPVFESPNFKAKNYKKQESILKFFAKESPTNKDKDKNKDQIKNNDKDLDNSTNSIDMNKSKEKSKVDLDNKEDLQVDIVENMDQFQNVEIEKKEKGDSKKCQRQPIPPNPFESNVKNKGPKGLNEFSRKIAKKRFVKPSLSKETTLSAAAIKNFRGRGPASRSNNKNAIKTSKSGTSTSMDQTSVNRAEIMISSEPELQEKEKTGLDLEINDQRTNTIHNDNDNDADHSLNQCSAKEEESFNLGGLLLKDTGSFDYQIVVNDQAFKVHKNVLSCQSEYFAKLFKTKNHQQSLHISDIDPKAFYSILNFLYKGNFQPQDSLNLKSILEYLGFGIKFGIKRLETFCKIQILKAEK